MEQEGKDACAVKECLQNPCNHDNRACRDCTNSAARAKRDVSDPSTPVVVYSATVSQQCKGFRPSSANHVHPEPEEMARMILLSQLRMGRKYRVNSFASKACKYDYEMVSTCSRRMGLLTWKDAMVRLQS